MNEHAIGTTVTRKFTTRSFTTGAAATLTSATLAVYEDSSTTESTNGVTLTADFDSVTGLNNLVIDVSSGNGFESGKHYDIVATAGSVDGVSVVGSLIYSFDAMPSVEDRVVDNAIAGHTTAGTVGAAINAAGASGDPWATVLPASYATNTAGKRIGDLASLIGVLDNVADAIKVTTDQLPDGGALTSLATASDLSTVDSVVDSILVELEHGTYGLSEIHSDLTAAATNISTLTTDWDDGGRLDLILDSRMAESSISTTGGAVDNVILVDVTALNTDMRGTDGANTAFPDNAGIAQIISDLDTDVAAIQAKLGTPAATIADDIAEIETDTTDIQNRIPSTLTSGNLDVNIKAVDGSVTAGGNLSKHAERVKEVTFSGGTTTTAVFVNVGSAPASSVDDVYNGRTLVFSAPSALEDQACTITDYDGASKTATISAVTTSVTVTSVAMLE